MNLTFTPSGWGDYQWFQEHDRKLVKRINLLVREIRPQRSVSGVI